MIFPSYFFDGLSQRTLLFCALLHTLRKGHPLQLIEDNNKQNSQYDVLGIKEYVSNPDTFIQIGSYFVDNYYTHRYDFYRKTYGMKNVGYIVCGLPLHIFFSALYWYLQKNNRLLAISRNFGNDWELISYLKGKPRLIFNVSIYFFISQ